MIEEVYAWVGKSLMTEEWELLGLQSIYRDPIPAFATKLDLALRMEDMVAMSIGHTEKQLVKFTRAEVIRKL